MRAGFAALLVGVTLVGCGVTRRSRSVAEDLMLAQTALRDGRPEEARELVAAARAQDPENLATVQWSAFVADLTWRDEAAVEERMAAVRLARARGGDAPERHEATAQPRRERPCEPTKKGTAVAASNAGAK